MAASNISHTICFLLACSIAIFVKTAYPAVAADPAPAMNALRYPILLPWPKLRLASSLLQLPPLSFPPRAHRAQRTQADEPTPIIVHLFSRFSSHEFAPPAQGVRADLRLASKSEAATADSPRFFFVLELASESMN
jgi:hypothetical protein